MVVAIVTETKAETMKAVIVAVDTAGLAHACGSVKAVIIAVDTAGVAHAYGSVDDSASSIVTLSRTMHRNIRAPRCHVSSACRRQLPQRELRHECCRRQNVDAWKAEQELLVCRLAFSDLEAHVCRRCRRVLGDQHLHELCCLGC